MNRFLNSLAIFCICITFYIPAAFASQTPETTLTKQDKEHLVLMPLRVPEDDQKLFGAMETALVQGLQERFNVYFGEKVEQKAREIFLKESRSTDKKECDEIRCFQGIAEAFKAELIAIAHVAKQKDGYFVSLNILNIIDSKVVVSKSIPCPKCNAYQVIDKLKELVGQSSLALPQAAVQTVDQTLSTQGKKSAKTTKERIVLMPIRLSESDKPLQGAMETALVEGLQQKYEVFAGEIVSMKAREIFFKESRDTSKKYCDETRCMQNIAEAFQTEYIATVNISKQKDGYFLALVIQNIFDNLVVYSNSVPCVDCSVYKVVDKLKELSDIHPLLAEPKQIVKAKKENAAPNF